MIEHTRIELNAEELRQKINLETAQMSWHELQLHFAKGNLIVVDEELDLIDVAAKFAEDDNKSITDWIKYSRITRAVDDHAIRWEKAQSTFWAVVVAPWILVQEINH